MAGFDNEVVYGSNVDFTGNANVEGQVDSNGQLLIGANSAPFIRVGTITSLDGTLLITNGPGTIDISASDTGDVQTITGNTGGAISPASGTINVITSNSTVVFAGSGNTETQDFGITNLSLGTSQPARTTAVFTASLGSGALQSITSGSQDTAVGYQAGQSLTTGSNNTFIGYFAGRLATTGTSNTALGATALAAYTSGAANAGSNLAIGSGSLTNLVTGTNNTAIGNSAGNAYTGSESSNVVIGSVGVLGESNIIRIGTQGSSTGQQTDCYLAGVLRTSSGRIVNVTSPGAYPYTALTTDYLILVDTSSARTINLLGSPTSGRTYVIKDNVGSAAANNITVNGNGSNIDSAASYTININYSSITVIYNGSTWSLV